MQPDEVSLGSYVETVVGGAPAPGGCRVRTSATESGARAARRPRTLAAPTGNTSTAEAHLYFTTHREMYYGVLQQIRLDGDWPGWVRSRAPVTAVQLQRCTSRTIAN